MTTALTAAYSVGDELFVAHVGHSRAYLFREGESDAADARSHDRAAAGRHAAGRRRVERRAQDLRHILTDAVGAPGARPMVEVERFQLMNGDCVLLCTNGLTDMIDDDRIADVLALRRHPDEQCAMLTELANREGGADNITVVLAQRTAFPYRDLSPSWAHPRGRFSGAPPVSDVRHAGWNLRHFGAGRVST